MIMNKIILLGRLTKSPEIMTTSNEKLVGKFTLAVPRKYVKEGAERESDFINIVTFGKNAEFIGKFFQKGQQVLVTGRLEINQYEDENGEKRYNAQIIGEEFDFADTKKEISEKVEENLDFLYENNNLVEKNEEETKVENNETEDDDFPF